MRTLYANFMLGKPLQKWYFLQLQPEKTKKWTNVVISLIITIICLFRDIRSAFDPQGLKLVDPSGNLISTNLACSVGGKGLKVGYLN